MLKAGRGGNREAVDRNNLFHFRSLHQAHTNVLHVARNVGQCNRIKEREALDVSFVLPVRDRCSGCLFCVLLLTCKRDWIGRGRGQSSGVNSVKLSCVLEF